MFDEESFSAYIGGIQGLRLAAARRVLASYAEVLANGTTSLMHPPLYTELAEEYVQTAVKIIDDEWEREGYARTQDTFTGGPRFGKHLGSAQQEALVWELRKALGRDTAREDCGKDADE